ncbi:lysine histidine transporter 1 [Actinidia rufa]|uniref:Lysine histidine transporter 1 n=1 Tax=Actinidia rufa TaxID=165716 RepID=A0A7J0H7P1_9ERIC|nr:lysine histidine transporter 1 [Actinidia rufa]
MVYGKPLSKGVPVFYSYWVDTRSKKEKAIDDWLPITSSRNAKWWYSAFHNVTAMVGAGVLGLPYAMSELGWGPGVTVLIISWVVTLYTLWQMVEMHEMVPGKRFDRYHELGQYAFGEKLGLYIVVPQQLVVEVGVDIVYMVTGGKSLKKFHDLVCKDCQNIKLTYFIMIFASVHFVLSHLPNFNSISGVSLAAAVMSLSYSTIAWASSLHKGVQDDVEYGYKAKTTAGTVFNFFSALGEVAFAYAGHNVVLEIQATIPSTPEKPSKGPMWRGVIVAYIVVALCYFPVALIGYWIFGNKVEDNILMSLEKPTWLIAMANMFVVIHVIGSYQIYAMPVFDMIETVLVKKLHFKPSTPLRFISRTVYVAFTMFVGITFPFFGGLLGFFGGFAFAPTTYFLPCIMWLAIYKPRKYSLSWIANWLCRIDTGTQAPENEISKDENSNIPINHAFGEKPGLNIVVPQQLICEVGVDIVYMVTGGKSLKKFHDLVCKDCKDIKLTYFIMIFASIHFILSNLPNFNSISGVSLAAAVMSLSTQFEIHKSANPIYSLLLFVIPYSTIATASIHKGVQADVEYGYKAKTASRTIFNFITALGDVEFAYAGHNVVLEIQAIIPSTPKKPSKKPMWKGVMVAYFIVVLCYFPRCSNWVLDVWKQCRGQHSHLTVANMFVVVYVIGSYQVPSKLLSQFVSRFASYKSVFF